MAKLPPLRYWSPELALRPDIDKQHKLLIYQYERLENAIKKGRGYEMLINIVLFLHQYALTHFQTEEREMLEHDYPEYGEHAEEHDLYKTRVSQFEYRMKAQPENPRFAPHVDHCKSGINSLCCLSMSGLNASSGDQYRSGGSFAIL